MGKRSEIKLELSGGMENLQEEESLMGKPGEQCVCTCRRKWTGVALLSDELTNELVDLEAC